MQRTLISDSLPRIASCCYCAGRMKPSGLGLFKPERVGNFSNMLESLVELTGSFMRTLLQSRSNVREVRDAKGLDSERRRSAGRGGLCIRILAQLASVEIA